jgi:hypothetical protein
MEITGVTYSNAHYEHYNQNGDRNYFEEVIDAMILDEIAGMNETFRTAISNLSKDKKRMTILSLLEKDIKLFNKIKALVDKDINKMDHIKDVVLMLREYVKIADVEKKKYGEVMTPLDLVKEMLNTLPKEVWSNPSLKWLDPANGTGPYPIMVIYKLMVGLKDWEPDDEKRYKHIVENMIYVAELQPKNMFLYMCAVDPFDKYKLNVYTGSYLEKEFDYHMKNIWGIEKYIIIGNPPYQELSTSDLKSSDQGRVKLWMKFVEKSLSMCDMLLFITPNNWLSSTCHLNEIFKSRLIMAQVDSNYLKDNYFKSVGSTFSFYLLSNKKNKEDNVYFLSGKDKMENDILSLNLFPTKDVTVESISIFEKVQKKINTNILFTREKYQLVDNIDLCISIDRSKNKGFVRLTEDIFSTSSYWYKCSNVNEQEILLNNLNTKLYKFLIKNIRSGMAIVSTINKLPIPNYKKMTDDDLFEFFKLTKEEIKFINK